MSPGMNLAITSVRTASGVELLAIPRVNDVCLLHRPPAPSLVKVLLATRADDAGRLASALVGDGECRGVPTYPLSAFVCLLLRFDGFDMMSGGNGYRVSDLNPVSKWCKHFPATVAQSSVPAMS